VHQDVPQRRAALAVRGELGPHVGDPQVVGQLTALDEHVRDGGGHALGRRRGEEQGVRGDGHPASGVGQARYRVHNQVSPVDNRYLEADLTAVGHESVDGVLDARLWGGRGIVRHTGPTSDGRESHRRN
jgi:hypothetical protein